MRFLSASLAALLSVGATTAVDYDTLERRLVKEPAYRSKAQEYALLLFGPKARLAVWVVFDGETVYLDRNGDGDLTAANERFAKEADCKDIDLPDPDGKTRYLITSLQSDRTRYTPAALRDREAKRLPLALSVSVSVKGAVEYKQYCDTELVRGDPKKAKLAHFHGPLTVGPRTINWKVHESTALRKGETPAELFAVIGTMSGRHGCWVVVQTCVGEKGTFAAGVRPVAEVEYPSADAKAAVVKKRYPLDAFC